MWHPSHAYRSNAAATKQRNSSFCTQKRKEINDPPTKTLFSKTINQIKSINRTDGRTIFSLHQPSSERTRRDERERDREEKGEKNDFSRGGSVPAIFERVFSIAFWVCLPPPFCPTPMPYYNNSLFLPPLRPFFGRQDTKKAPFPPQKKGKKRGGRRPQKPKKIVGFSTCPKHHHHHHHLKTRRSRKHYWYAKRSTIMVVRVSCERRSNGLVRIFDARSLGRGSLSNVARGRKEDALLEIFALSGEIGRRNAATF